MRRRFWTPGSSKPAVAEGGAAVDVEEVNDGDDDGEEEDEPSPGPLFSTDSIEQHPELERAGDCQPGIGFD